MEKEAGVFGGGGLQDGSEGGRERRGGGTSFFLSFKRKGEQEGRWLVRRSGRGTEREQVEEQGTVSGECFKDGYRRGFGRGAVFFVGRRE